MATQSQKTRTQSRPTKRQKQIAARQASTRQNAAAQARRQRSGRLMWIAVVIVVVIGVAFAVASRGGSKTSAAPRSPAPAALVAQVTSVPTSVINQVAAGSVTAYPKAINGAALTTGGKVHVIYIGEESCPYCATERWALVNALSRFGTFSNLSLTHSATVDVFPGTNTFSFYGSTYSSTLLSFESVELTTNQLASGGGYQTLETPTAEQQQLMTTYDAPPYTTAAAKNGIPFIDFGGKYMIEGATYDPTVLQGKSADQIASALSDPTSAISKGAIGAANTMTAALCTVTHDKPAAVCANSTIQTIQSRLG